MRVYDELLYCVVQTCDMEYSNEFWEGSWRPLTERTVGLAAVHDGVEVFDERAEHRVRAKHPSLARALNPTSFGLVITDP